MSELVDLVDKDGVVVQTGVERDDAAVYPNAFMRIVIGVITNSSGDILIHERANTKSVARNCIDHVCGGIISGESPEDAFIREARDEVGVVPTDIQVVAEGVNAYGRYRILMHGVSNEEPTDVNFDEVNWAGWRSKEELQTGKTTGFLKFVDGFFEDLELVSTR